MIRVGRRVYKGGKPTDPSFEGFIPILVLTKSYKRWYALSPYSLKNDEGHIMENIWQFSKVYETIPENEEHYSRYDKRVIWSHPAERHVGTNGILTKEYWSWREKGFNNKESVRYPVGFQHRTKCLYTIKEDKHEYNPETSKKLSYIEARKAIYMPVYNELARKTYRFKELKKLLKEGKNLLIIEVDGPHEESMDYYKKEYGVDDDFIQDSTILVNKENMEIMLNDEKHAFGHGYCLAIALLDLDKD